jgi:hypothetical protein
MKANKYMEIIGILFPYFIFCPQLKSPSKEKPNLSLFFFIKKKKKSGPYITRMIHDQLTCTGPVFIFIVNADHMPSQGPH